MKLFKTIFIILFFFLNSSIQAQDSSKYIVNNYVYSFGLYNTYSKTNNDVNLGKNGCYSVANEIRPKIGFSLHVMRMKLKAKKWTSSPEARLHFYRDYVNTTNIRVFEYEKGVFENIKIPLQDIYLGFGQNIYRPINNTLIFESGIFFDYLLVGTRGNRIVFGEEEKPNIGNFTYGSIKYSDEILYSFSQFRSSIKIGILKLVPLSNTTKRFLFRLNLEQTFFQTPVSLKLRQTFLNANIGLIF